jgi:hypothetical protein
MSDDTMRSLTAAIAQPRNFAEVAFSTASGLTFWLALLRQISWFGMQASQCTFGKAIIERIETYSFKMEEGHRDLLHLQISKFPRKLDISRRNMVRPRASTSHFKAD